MSNNVRLILRYLLWAFIPIVAFKILSYDNDIPGIFITLFAVSILLVLIHALPNIGKADFISNATPLTGWPFYRLLLPPILGITLSCSAVLLGGQMLFVGLWIFIISSLVIYKNKTVRLLFFIMAFFLFIPTMIVFQLSSSI